MTATDEDPSIVAGLAPWRLPLHEIVLKPNVPAGMDFAVLGGLAAMMRKTRKDPPPIEVSPLPCGHWQLEDGRHRYMGAVIAGRPDVLATLAPEGTPT